MTTEELKELKGNISSGPWELYRTFQTHNHPTKPWETHIMSPDGSIGEVRAVSAEQSVINAKLIISAPSLLDECLEMRAELKAANEIKSAEKEILLQEVAKNAALQAERDQLRGALAAAKIAIHTFTNTPASADSEKRMVFRLAPNAYLQIRQLEEFVDQTLRDRASLSESQAKKI